MKIYFIIGLFIDFQKNDTSCLGIMNIDDSVQSSLKSRRLRVTMYIKIVNVKMLKYINFSYF